MMNVFSTPKRKWDSKPTVVTQAGNVEEAAKNNGICGAEAIIGTWTLYTRTGEREPKMVIEPGMHMIIPDYLTKGKRKVKSFSVNGDGESWVTFY